MKANPKRILCIILSLIMLLGLCACDKDTNNDNGNNSNNNGTNLGGYEGELPEVVFGTWYPHPEVSDAFIEISSDGACTIDGQALNWNVEAVEEDSVVLTAGMYYLTFTQLSSDLPLLSASGFEMSVKDPEIWNYMTEWYNQDTGIVFALDLEELAQVDCNILFGSGSMTIEVLEGENITHIIELNGDQATVTDAEGNISVYFTINGGGSGGGNDGDSDDFEVRYQQAVENLQNVLAGGEMIVFENNGSVGKTLSGAKAIENLYHTFVSLQNYVDVSEQLNCIRRVDNVLVKRNSIYSTNNIITKEYWYDCYGGIERIYEAEAVTSKNYLCYGYKTEGEPNSLTICGVVSGVPVFDYRGNITALRITSKVTEKTYTAPVTCDSDGRVTCVEVPFAEDRGTAEAKFVDKYQFLYDAAGKLIQYTKTKIGEFGWEEFYIPRGYYEKSVTEYYYDATEKLTMSVTHHEYTDGPGSAWERSITNYVYDSLGNLVQETWSYSTVLIPTQGADTAVRQTIFNSDGFVDSIGKDLFGQSSLEFTPPTEMPPYEYEYGSIYIYQADE